MALFTWFPLLFAVCVHFPSIVALRCQTEELFVAREIAIDHHEFEYRVVLERFPHTIFKSVIPSMMVMSIQDL